MTRTFWAALIIAAVFATSAAMARTWRVEQDGSGDFQVIQHAVNAAASGDTVCIGPGEYMDHFQVDPPQDYYSACVQLKQAELTIIGAGADSTFIGPQGDGWDGWDGEHARTIGIFADGYWDNRNLYLKGVTVRNANSGLLSWRLEHTDIDECAFKGNRSGIFISEGRFLVQGSWFGGQPSNGRHLRAHSTPNSIVENCRFEETSIVQTGSVHLSVSWRPSSVEVRNCSFLGGYDAFSIGGVEVNISNCMMKNLQGYAIGVGSGAALSVENCTVDVAEGGLFSSYSGSDITVSNTSFRSLVEASVVFDGLSDCTITNCNLAKGVRYVATSPYGLPPQEKLTIESRADLRNNWWGTSDPDSIQAWIFDAADDSTLTVIFDWYPYLDAPVANEHTSTGGLKRMFR